MRDFARYGQVIQPHWKHLDSYEEDAQISSTKKQKQKRRLTTECKNKLKVLFSRPRELTTHTELLNTLTISQDTTLYSNNTTKNLSTGHTANTSVSFRKRTEYKYGAKLRNAHISLFCPISPITHRQDKDM